MARLAWIRRILEWRYFLLACLAASCLLRLAAILLIPTTMGADARWYFLRAVSLAGGHGYVFQGHPTAYWPIGFPAFLAVLFKVFGASAMVGKIANTILYLGMIALSNAIARDLFKPKAIASLTALLLAIWPNNILFSAVVLSETLYTFATMLGIWLVLKSRARLLLCIPAGMAFGYAILTREIGWFVPIVVTVVLLRAEEKPELRKHWVTVLLITNVVAMLTVLPWTIRNYLAFGHFVPVTNNSGVNLYLGNNPGANGGNIYGDAVFDYVRAEHRSLMNEWEWNQVCRDYAVRYALQHPAHEVKLTAMRLGELFLHEDSLGWVQKALDEDEAEILRDIVRVFYCAVIGVFVAGFTLHFIRRKNSRVDSIPTLGLWLMLFWTLPCLITHGEGRYHYQMTPWMAMYASLFIAGWFKLIERSSPECRSAPTEDRVLATAR